MEQPPEDLFPTEMSQRFRPTVEVNARSPKEQYDYVQEKAREHLEARVNYRRRTFKVYRLVPAEDPNGEKHPIIAKDIEHDLKIALSQQETQPQGSDQTVQEDHTVRYSRP